MPRFDLFPKMAQVAKTLAPRLQVPVISTERTELATPAYVDEEWLSQSVRASVSSYGSTADIDRELAERTMELAQQAQARDPIVVPSLLYDANGAVTHKPGLVVQWYKYNEVRVIHVVSSA